MRDVGILEAADDMDDRVGLADVGEELVAESFALSRAFHEPADVDDLDHCVTVLSRLHDPGEPRPAAGRALYHASMRPAPTER